jgi:hypothetical protein
MDRLCEQRLIKTLTGVAIAEFQEVDVLLAESSQFLLKLSSLNLDVQDYMRPRF